MAEINFSLLQPVDVGALTSQGFATGMAMVKRVQTQGALNRYLANPDDPQAYSALAAYDPQAAGAMQAQRLQQRKLEQIAEQEARTRAIGAQAASGDVSGARSAALQAGDFDLAKHFDEISDEERKRTVAGFKAAAPIAFKLRQIKDPAQRQALFNQARPQLEASGFSPEKLDQFDVTNDTALDAIISSGQTVDQLIDQGKITWHQQGEQPSFATDFMGRPVGSQNPYAKGSAVTPAVSAVGSILSQGGLPANVTAGFLGNFHAEGGYGGAKGDGGTAAGIAQWRGERQQNFERVIGKPVTAASPEEQAKFVLWEMQNPEAAGMSVAERDAILAARSPAEAAELIDKHYERSSGQHRAKRVAAANRLAGAASDPDTIKQQAQAAIAKGADPAKVRARAKEMGVEL